MDIKTIIANKRKKKELTEEEIKFFISKYNKGEVTEAQAGTLVSFIYEDGMTIDEITALATAVSDSGEKIDLDEMGIDVVYEHSTGGVGDKVSLILLPVIASLGIPIAKVSTGNNGVLGGISQKLESIPGFNANIETIEFRNMVKIHDVGILNQSININPVEKKLYRLRNEVGCTDSIPIIAASLMSFNLSIGTKKLVFELIFGKGSYIKTKEKAVKLSKVLKAVGNKLGKQVKCVIINNQEPIGYSVGHNLEIIEVINALKGNISYDLSESVVKTGGIILSLDNQNTNRKENENKIREVLANGKAYDKFIEMIGIERWRY